VHTGELHNLYSSPDIIRQIKTRRIRWAGHVAHIGEGRKVYRVLVGKPQGKRPLERPKRRWEDGSTVDLKEIGWGDGEWIHLPQDMDLRVQAPRGWLPNTENVMLPRNSLISRKLLLLENCVKLASISRNCDYGSSAQKWGTEMDSHLFGTKTQSASAFTLNVLVSFQPSSKDHTISCNYQKL
jgi:hypothetical protein